VAALAAIASRMIRARIASAGAFAWLARRAGTIVAAAAESRLRARQRDPLRWRMARLLWPAFTKGP